MLELTPVCRKRSRKEGKMFLSHLTFQLFLMQIIFHSSPTPYVSAFFLNVCVELLMNDSERSMPLSVCSSCELVAAFNVSLLINTQVPALVPALAHISAVWFHTKCAHTLQAPVALPCSCLYTSLSSWEWVCLENMSSVDARRLFSCQKILFTFHFYTVPQPYSGAFSSVLRFQKLVPPALLLFPCLFLLATQTNWWIWEPTPTNIHLQLFLQARLCHVWEKKWLLLVFSWVCTTWDSLLVFELRFS